MRELPPFKPFHDPQRDDLNGRDRREGRPRHADRTPAFLPSSPALWLALALSVAGLFLPAEGCRFNWPTPPGPNPSPGPGPDPTPDVVVDPSKTKGSWVILLEETAERTPEITRVVVNESFWGGLEDRGLKYRLIDRNADAFEPYRAIASEIGIPCILILSPTGEVLTKTTLPKSTGELDQIVERVTGR